MVAPVALLVMPRCSAKGLNQRALVALEAGEGQRETFDFQARRHALGIEPQHLQIHASPGQEDMVRLAALTQAILRDLHHPLIRLCAQLNGRGLLLPSALNSTTVAIPLFSGVMV